MFHSGVCPHLADLVERVLSVSAGVLEVVMGRERPVDVPRYGTVLRGLLGERHRGRERERERERERGRERGEREAEREERGRERGEREMGEGER